MIGFSPVPTYLFSFSSGIYSSHIYSSHIYSVSHLSHGRINTLNIQMTPEANLLAETLARLMLVSSQETVLKSLCSWLAGKTVIKVPTSKPTEKRRRCIISAVFQRASSISPRFEELKDRSSDNTEEEGWGVKTYKMMTTKRKKNTKSETMINSWSCSGGQRSSLKATSRKRNNVATTKQATKTSRRSRGHGKGLETSLRTKLQGTVVGKQINLIQD